MISSGKKVSDTRIWNTKSRPNRRLSIDSLPSQNPLQRWAFSSSWRKENSIWMMKSRNTFPIFRGNGGLSPSGICWATWAGSAIIEITMKKGTLKPISQQKNRSECSKTGSSKPNLAPSISTPRTDSTFWGRLLKGHPASPMRNIWRKMYGNPWGWTARGWISLTP